MSVPDMDANGNHPAEWLLFGLFPGETLSTWQRERDSGLVKEIWLAEGDGIANCYQYGFYYRR